MDRVTQFLATNCKQPLLTNCCLLWITSWCNRVRFHICS